MARGRYDRYGGDDGAANQTYQTELVLAAEGDSRYDFGCCNTFNREYYLRDSLYLLRSRKIYPRILLLLRQPVEHVRSMWAHCIANRYDGVSPMPLGQWLGMFTVTENGTLDPAAREAGLAVCYYVPINYQTSLLGGYRESHGHVSQRAQQQVLSLIRTQAYFVGVTEHYRSSLCLLATQLTKLSAAATPQHAQPCVRDLGVLRTSHVDHRARANELSLSGPTLARINRITRADQITYAAALSRFHTDATLAGIVVE